ncbi:MULTISPECIES: SMI1/KNR4 family protein [unclassified Streptomyces]|uniref:SMI1/KNR4 family protein n=1 Tax=unclassified Streptomyces TaxID=2593676 RepID=UPI0004BD017B|nr:MULTISPECIES: SMI1/KNR4 family protein [unclassified Streptomyces]
MVDQRPRLPSAICDFTLWEPVLRLLRAYDTERHTDRPVRGAGRMGKNGWSLPLRGRVSPACRRVVGRVRSALARAGVDEIAFDAEIRPSGKTTLRLIDHGPAVEATLGRRDLGVLVLVENALPEPWRRLPEPIPDARPARSADLELLERTLRERLPDTVGVAHDQIAAVEARLGVTLPEELRVLYRLVPERWEDCRDAFEAVGCELFTLENLYCIDGAGRCPRWGFAATETAVTRSDAAVQGLAGSPGWIVFGDNGGGDRLAVDLTPGPRGHTGQIILIDHEKTIGAALVADSLTDLVLGRLREKQPDRPADRAPIVAAVGSGGPQTTQAAAHPALEVLSIGACDGAPFSLAPLVGLPRLRTLIARPGTLADPLEIAELTGLEFLELGPTDWRALLGAGAVPHTLSAAAITAHGDEDPMAVVAIANELLDLWDRPRIIQTVLEGDLGRVA